MLQGWRSELLWLSCLVGDELGQCSPKHFGIHVRESKAVNKIKLNLSNQISGPIKVLRPLQNSDHFTKATITYFCVIFKHLSIMVNICDVAFFNSAFFAQMQA